MLTTRKDANPNYLARVVRLKGVRKHENADRLQCVDINFQTVITGLDAKDGDIYIFFPIESKINLDFLAYTNSFRKSLNLNKDPEQEGFFEGKGRVRALRLREEKSMGYIVSVSVIKDFAGTFNHDDFINVDFDTINGILLVEKYEAPKRGGSLSKQGKQPKTNRLIDGQVRLHVDTENLRLNAYKISPHEDISITYKTHGTSWWVGNLMVKKRLTRMEKILKYLGVNIVDTEYDHVYGSRKVIKNKALEDPKSQDHFYGYDLWEDIKNQLAEHIPKGFTLYGEALGYTKEGGYIQKGFDYGCEEGEMKLEIYRITQTNSDGFVTELSHDEITEFCNRAGLNQSTTFHNGKAYWILPNEDVNAVDWTEKFVKQLEAEYNNKKCGQCVNDVWEEGIVVRRASLFGYEAYKLKSFNFLEQESISLDKDDIDIESMN